MASSPTIPLTTERDVKFALHTHGVCVAGFAITSGWNVVSRSGWIGTQEDGIGGHAVLLCYYDADGIGFQNSWLDWGVRGFGRMTWGQFLEQFMYGAVIE